MYWRFLLCAIIKAEARRKELVTRQTIFCIINYMIFIGDFPKMIRYRKVLLFAAFFSLFATIASSIVESKIIFVYPGIMGCQAGCYVVAGGWPFPFIIDYPGLSPVNSVSIVDALLGLDILSAAGLAKNLLFWVLISFVFAFRLRILEFIRPKKKS